MATSQQTIPAESAKSTPTIPKRKPNFKKFPSKIDKSRLPEPKKLSTIQTPLTNDPLWTDAFVLDGENGLTNEDTVREFKADAAGYVSLVEEEYKAITDTDKQYAKAIPASAHAYYHHVIYWYRHALHAQKHGVADRDDDNLVRFVEGYQTVIAAGAATYLAGMGDYEDLTGVKHRLASDSPNANGHFGQIGAANHSLYEHLPTPAFCLQRVLEDINATGRDYNNHDTWDIAEITPEDVVIGPLPEAPQQEEDLEGLGADDGAEQQAPPPEPPVQENRPTVNLLGWRKAVALTSNQLANMRSVFAQQENRFDNVDADIPTYSVVRGLFELVYRRLREVKRYKTLAVPTSTTGSMAQQMTWVPTDVSRNRFQQYVNQEGYLSSRTMAPVRMAVAAKIMAYRSRRDPIQDYNPWSAYHFNRYDEVPNGWSNNRNTRANTGTPGMIQYAPFTSVHSSRRDALVEFLNKFKTD